MPSRPLPLRTGFKKIYLSIIYTPDIGVGFPVVITLRVTLSFTYAGALRVIKRLLRLRKKV